MKSLVQILLGGAAMAAGSVYAASKIHVNDSLDNVVACLGQAPGRVNCGSLAVLYYERGSVELRGR